MKKTIFFISLISIPCCLSLAAGLFLSINTSSPDHILLQIYVVIAIFTLVNGFYILENKSLSLFILLVKLFCIYFITNADRSSTIAVMILVSSLSYETFLILPFWQAFPVFVYALFLCIQTTVPQSAWNAPLKQYSVYEILFILLASLAWATTGFVIGNLTKKNSQKTEEIKRLDYAVHNLTRTNIAWQTYATYIEENSKEDERNRISRDIHDIVGYSMTNLLMIVQAALYSDNQDKVTELLQKAQSHINHSLQEVRQAMRKLRSTSKTTLHGSKLIRYLVENFESVTGIKVQLDFISFPRFISIKVEEVVYRLLQESMTNAFKHTKASTIYITFSTIGSALFISIRDNGEVNIELPIAEGIGIKGMRERIVELGGHLKIQPAQDGFTVTAYIPLEEKEKEMPLNA